MQPSPCDGFYPLAHVCQADEPALLLGRQAVGGNVIGAAAVILHGDQPVVGLLAGGNGHGAAAPLVANAVGDGVFYQRLQGQRWQQEILGFNIIYNLQLVAKAQLLQRGVVARVG